MFKSQCPTSNQPTQCHEARRGKCQMADDWILNRNYVAYEYVRVSYIPPFVLASILPIAIAILPLSFHSQNHIIWTPESRRREVPKLVQFWDPFWGKYGSQNDSGNYSKLAKKTHNFRVLWTGLVYVREEWQGMSGLQDKTSMRTRASGKYCILAWQGMPGHVHHKAWQGMSGLEKHAY